MTDSSPAGPSPSDRLYRICEEGLCIGCGLCASLAPPEALEIVATPEGSLRPLAGEALTHDQVDRIYRLCPGTHLEGLPEALRSPEGILDPLWGALSGTVPQLYAADPEVRFKAATGGVLTALAIFLLESGRVAFVVQARPSKERPSFGEQQISRTRDEVLAGAGSRYGPTATLIGMEEILSRGEPFAFVGTPCDVTGLRNLAHEDARVDELCRMMMAPVCGGFMQTPALAERVEDSGIAFENLKSIRYRGYGCPGPTRMEDRDGKVVERSYLDFWGEDESKWSLPWRCKICADGIGEAADIAASDVWPGGAPTREQAENHEADPGSNAVLMRSARGAALVAAALEAGALASLSDHGPRDLDLWQPHQVKKKRAVWARYKALEAEGRLVPQTERLRLEELFEQNPDEANRAEIDGSCRRIREGKASEPRPRRQY